MGKQITVFKPSQATHGDDATPAAIERLLRELRLLSLVLTLTSLAALLFILDRLPRSELNRILWFGLVLLVFGAVYGFIHRRASQLTQSIRAQAAQELARSRGEFSRFEASFVDQLEVILGSLTDGVVLYDASERLLSVNHAALAIPGHERVAIGTSVEDWATRIGLCYPSGQPVPPGAIPLMRTLKTGLRTDREEFLLTAGTEPRTVELSVAPFHSLNDSSGAESVGAIAILRDVTDLRRSRHQENTANVRVGALVQIGRRLSAPLVEGEIHAAVAEGALALLPASIAVSARCLLHRREEDRLLPLANIPETRSRRRTRQRSEQTSRQFDAKSPLLWEIYIQRCPVVCDDVTADARFAAESDRLLLQDTMLPSSHIRSVLMLPLVARSVVTGHLTLTSPEVSAFNDIGLLDALLNLASLATIARANFQMHTQVSQRTEELDALWTIGQAVVTQTHLADVADALTERIRSVFSAELCTLALWETRSNGERSLHRVGRSHEEALLPEQSLQVVLECGGCDAASYQGAERGEAVTKLGIGNPPFGCCRWRAFSGQSGTHSVLSAPLHQGDVTSGTLTIYRNGDAAFTPEQVKLLQTFAALAVIAVRT